MSESARKTDEEVRVDLAEKVQLLFWSLDDPAAIARKLADWASEYLPERMASAVWIDLKGNRDKGMEVRLIEKPMSWLQGRALRLGALLGAWSCGLNVSTDVYRTAGGATLAVGLGAVVPYQNLRDVRPVASFTLRF
ncbi:MAG TPA: hypothetical protein DCQ64_12535 [Candidatus Rokubacteria bacterium]|nr:hypothetical protein [Candidatus Rokubacteria bacterium]